MLSTTEWDAVNGIQSSARCDNDFPSWWKQPSSTGTTIIASEFDNGVVLAADSRTTQGSFIADRISEKVDRISDHIYCVCAGSRADTIAVVDIVRYHLAFHEMELGEKPLVKVAANLFRELGYKYRDNLKTSFIVAGWDKELGGQVYGLPMGGMLSRLKVTSGGSGGIYAAGYLDANFKENLTESECVNLVTTAVSLGMKRDGSSGGVIRLSVINEQGANSRVILGDEVPRHFDHLDVVGGAFLST